MTRPSYIGVAAVNNFTLTTFTNMTRPAGATAGKAWIIMIHTNNARTFNIPTGFARMGTAGANSDSFIRICDGSEGSTVSVSWSGGNAAGQGLSSAWDNIDPNNPVLIAGSWDQVVAQASIAISGVTVPLTQDNDLLVSFLQAINNVRVATKPGSMTQDYQVNTPATLAIAEENPSTGATGTRTWTWTNNVDFAGQIIVLKGTEIPQSMGILTQV